MGEQNEASKAFDEHIIRVFEHALKHASDEGLLVGERHKRVEVATDSILWYEWLSGTKVWSKVILDDEYLEAAFQAGTKVGREKKHEHTTEQRDRTEDRINREY